MPGLYEYPWNNYPYGPNVNRNAINYGYAPVQMQQSQQNGIIRVHGKEGALTLGNNMGPNKSAIVVDDTESDIEWVIVTDGAGFPTLQKFKFIKIDDNAETNSVKEDPPVYVTTKEFDALKDKVDKLFADLNGTNS